MMRTFFLLLMMMCLGIFKLEAQAPMNPEGGNHISRIDSLTQVLLGNIPSHSPVGYDEARYRNGKEFEALMSQIGSTIPFQYHRMVEQHIRYFMGYGEGYFNQIHERMKLYFPFLKKFWIKMACQRS